MSWLRNISDRLKVARKRYGKVVSAFWNDVKKNLWEGLAKNAANLILLVLFVALGGYVVTDYIQELQESRQKVTRCFRGTVFDAHTDKPVPGVSVGIQGDDKWTIQTDENGQFELCIKIPEIPKEREITLSKEGYRIEEYPREAVPQSKETEFFYKPYVITPLTTPAIEQIN